MALNIFDLDDAPKPSNGSRFSEDIVGSIRGGYQENDLPVATETLTFLSDDPDVTDALIAVFGGEVEELDVEKGFDRRIVSDTSEVVLLLDSPESLRSQFVLYGQSGLVFATDGDTITDGETYSGASVGEPWTDKPESLKIWKERAKKGRAPKPQIKITGKIEGLENLGYFRYQTSGWSLVTDLPDIENKLEASTESPIRVKLSFKRVKFTIKGGPNKGDEVSYVRPYVEVL